MRRTFGLAVISVALAGCGTSGGGSDAGGVCPPFPEPEVCLEDICHDAVELEVERDGAWAPGRWEAALLVDGEPVGCALEIEGGTSDLHARTPRSASCDVRPWEISVVVACGTAGCATEGPLRITARTVPEAFGGTIAPVLPARIDLQLSGPDGFHLQRVVTPDYVCTPNCPPCAQAVESVEAD